MLSKYAEGPYNLCLQCPKLGDGCDGPNTLSMSLERWCAWCKALKQLRGFTNLYISEKSGVSLPTIDRIMSGTVSKDIMRSTASDVTRVLVGSSGKWPCTLASNDPDTARELSIRMEELSGARASLESIHSSYQKELDAIREEMKKKTDFLLAENARLQKLLDQKDEIIARKDAAIERKDLAYEALVEKITR